MEAKVLRALWGTMARRVVTVLIFALVLTGFGYSMGTHSITKKKSQKALMNKYQKAKQASKKQKGAKLQKKKVAKNGKRKQPAKLGHNKKQKQSKFAKQGIASNQGFKGQKKGGKNGKFVKGKRNFKAQNKKNR